MNEAYAEWLVKRKTPIYLYIINAVMVALTVISVFCALAFGVVAMIVMFLLAVATYFVIRNANVEYEYLYVTGELSIDRIYGRSKRKKAWECTMEEIQIIAPADSYVIKDYESSNQKVLDFTSGLPDQKTYVVIARRGGDAFKALIEPNDKMLHCFRQTAPRKVIQ